MKTSRRTQWDADLVTYRYIYMAELARGSSHIASTLSVASRDAAIVEVVIDFQRAYKQANVAVFLELLAQALQKRQHDEAAAAIRHVDTQAGLGEVGRVAVAGAGAGAMGR